MNNRNKSHYLNKYLFCYKKILKMLHRDRLQIVEKNLQNFVKWIQTW